MKRKNGLLVAAVTVAAVVLGGVLASRQAPRTEGVADATPLSATTPLPLTTKPSIPPSAPPTTPSGTPTSTGPTTVTPAVSKLGKGRPPQIPYLVGREVRGGAGDAVKIPGTADVLEVARVNDSVLALTTEESGTRVLRLDANGPKSISNVNRMAANEDQTGAAYAAYRITGSPVEGSTLYADSGNSLKSLEVSTGWDFQVLAYVNGKVFFQSSSTLGAGGTWSTYEWTPGAAKAKLVQTVPNLTTVSSDARVAATRVLLNDTGTCSAVTAVDTGKRLWKTCDSYLNGFTPDGATVLAVPSADEGYCSVSQSVLDAQTGRLIREWKGCFQRAVAEDDEHVLIVAIASGGGGEEADRVIIRCAISTGTCELATPIISNVRLELAK